MCGETTRAERGSVLMLMPAAVLILMLLAAIAVDATILFLAERELANAAAAAANDAAVAALDEAAFYTDGVLRLESGRAVDVAAASLAARRAEYLLEPRLSVTVENVSPEVVRVHVSAEANVGLIFAKAIPGAPSIRQVAASSTATATTGR